MLFPLVLGLTRKCHKSVLFPCFLCLKSRSIAVFSEKSVILPLFHEKHGKCRNVVIERTISVSIVTCDWWRSRFGNDSDFLTRRGQKCTGGQRSRGFNGEKSSKSVPTGGVTVVSLIQSKPSLLTGERPDLETF